MDQIDASCLLHMLSGDDFDPRRDAFDQMLCVGMLRVEENIFGQSLFHNDAPLHDSDSLAEFSHDIEVVGDKEHGYSVLFVELFEEL